VASQRNYYTIRDGNSAGYLDFPTADCFQLPSAVIYLNAHFDADSEEHTCTEYDFKSDPIANQHACGKYDSKPDPIADQYLAHTTGDFAIWCPDAW